MNSSKSTGLELPLQRGPFQNNGATPWYCELGIGSPSQKLKICFDTGSNFNWVTSSLCAEDSCKHYADSRFNMSASSTFEWISTKEQSVSFGPWGTMEVETGSDRLSFPHVTHAYEFFTDLFLAKAYSGSQFEELDWDGGIGLPSSQNSSMNQVNNASPFRFHYSANDNGSQPKFDFFLQLVQMGLVSEKTPYISFLTESVGVNDAIGSIGFGRLDKSYASSREYIYLPWSCYQKEASYLWSSSGASVSVAGKPVGTDMFFSLDSGSSQFKGDERVLSQLFDLTKDNNPVVSISLSDETGQEYGSFEITSDIYKCEIEAGEKKGQIVSQFQGLSGADNMLLVGSVLMDHLYTVYEYEMVSGNDIQPKGVWVFNKHGGPKIIKTKQTSPASLFNNLNEES
ncbi:pepsin-like aspartic protease [Vibrio sp. F74]|uniref:pepsin-like aspartic protease n=1 Tax=Vibrio sp. F74 TaxID=700020 RepID=UPI0035F5B789